MLDLAEAVGWAQQGDAEAFRLLYRDIQPRLLRYLHVTVTVTVTGDRRTRETPSR